MILPTSDGPLVVEHGADALVARGVQYATALRFAPPVPLAPWSEPVPATSFGPQAPQLPSVLDRMVGPAGLPQSEDCLFLNVWAPPDARPGDGRPVLVYLHGGAFTNGTGAAQWFDGTGFARAGCVLVTLNYRLGVLGFTQFADEPNEELALTGNLGLLDQTEALRWVARNIAAFGGAPENVTLFGESAGGTSVLALMAAPSAEGLFRRGWAMSPSMTQLRTAERALDAGQRVLRALDLPRADAAALRSLPLAALLAVQAAPEADLAPRRDADPFTRFGPTPDGQFLPRSVVRALVDGPGRAVPLVLGTTKDEMNLFTLADPSLTLMDEAGLLTRARPFLGPSTADAVAAYRELRPGSTPGQLASHIATDQAFRAPATRLAAARGESGAPTWLYWFTWASPALGGILGSCHGIDIPFAFDTLDAFGVTPFTGDGPERPVLAQLFHGAIVAFACDGSVAWPQYRPPERSVWRVDVPPELVPDPEPALRAFWPDPA